MQLMQAVSMVLAQPMISTACHLCLGMWHQLQPRKSSSSGARRVCSATEANRDLQSNPSPNGLHQARGRVFHSHTAALQERTARTETQNEARALLQKLPVYKWLVALPQLTSRICHPNTDVKTLTHEILKKVAATFPQQACPLVLWPVCLVLWHPREESQRHALKAIG